MGARVTQRLATVLHVACAIFVCLAPGGTHANGMPPPAYQSAAHTHGVPANVLFAIALQESGMLLRGRLIPWPWTLTVAGRPYRFANRTEACEAIRRALLHFPPTRIDVGLGQINVGFHGHRVAHPCALLDPYQNLALTARILHEHYTLAEDWVIAIGYYHRPAGGERAEHYRRAVQRHLRRIADASVRAEGTGGTLP
jgi:hypothetical protein